MNDELRIALEIWALALAIGLPISMWVAAKLVRAAREGKL